MLIRKWFSFVRFGMCCSFYAIGSGPEFKTKKQSTEMKYSGFYLLSLRVFFIYFLNCFSPSTSFFFFFFTGFKKKRKTVIRSLACRATRTCCLPRGLSTKKKKQLFFLFFFLSLFCRLYNRRIEK